ncbi:MAG TPA: histidine kinase [Bacteroidia bacterium]|jgi:hypothetical protein|nr:histidine kinase [Bacteroidia bacterium]
MQQQEEVAFALIIGTVLFLFLCFCLLLFFILFKNSKKRHIEEKKRLELAYKHELANVTIEIQEHILEQISRELHDNIGQLLTVARIHLTTVVKHPEKRTNEKLQEANSVVDMAISELRILSKMPNTDKIKQFSLLNALTMEIERINKLESVKTILLIKGEIVPFGSDTKIIIFRIIQEFICNTIKYANASELNIVLNYDNDNFVLDISDNGKGFDMNLRMNQGNGISNIKNRATLIGAVSEYKSGVEGTSLKLTVKNFKNTLLN